MMKFLSSAARCVKKSTRRATTTSFHCESLEPRRVLDSTVVFNEIMYNPITEDSAMEFIELQNQLVVDMDISDWRLAGGVEYQFPDGTIVPGRGQIVVAIDPDALESATGLTDVHGPWTGRLANGGEALHLYNNDGRRMNSVAFEDGGDWPEAPDGGGWSLSKFDQLSASHKAENWTFSREFGGTPGADNFAPEFSVERIDVLANGAPATAIVPSDDSLGDSWIVNDFDDSGWLQGTSGVGYDSGRGEPYNDFIGLDFDAPPNGQEPMPMEDVNPSAYIRIPFELDRDPTDFERLTMLLRYEDGFVAYLNGVEWVSKNAPGRDGEEGELAWNSESEGSNPDTAAVKPEPFDMLSNPDLLRQGRNVIAFHALNRRVGDNDLLIAPSIVGVISSESSETINPLRFSEIAAAGDENFFVEVVNPSTTAQELTGVVLRTDDGNSEYVFPDGTLAPGERIAIDSSQLNFTESVGSMVHMLEPGKRIVIDARKVSDRLQGVHETSGEWQYPTSPTPGNQNEFEIESDVVINEIMYSAPKTPGFFETPPEIERTTFFPLDWGTWRYNQAGVDLGRDWHATTHSVDNVGWFEGAAPFGYTTNDDLAATINTELVSPRDNDPRFTTHYFQTTFDVSADTLAQADVVGFNHLFDDGAVIYLNGQEVSRINLGEGDLDFETRATPVVLPTLNGPFSLPEGSLVAGTNVLSVELHQDSNRSRDIYMALEMFIGKEVTDAIPGQLAKENDEEWIELYNKGTDAVDLSGWTLRDGVRFDFEEGASLGAGEYLVVARNGDELQAKYPNLAIAGSYEGTLNNHDDRLRLYDSSGNLADDVHYFEGGKWPVAADGGGSSLELIDANADNSNAAVWAPSDSSDASNWVSHSRRGRAELDVTGTRAAFHEFIFGMLKGSEILIDDIQVIQDPDGDAIPLLQNGTFDADAIGDSPAGWRLIGNHSGVVTADPLDANNKVLHVTATGAQAHIHDHAETTFVDDREIIIGMEYEISFRAKWLTGNSQLHSRLFYNRIPDTLNLHVPETFGTPGAANTSVMVNAGPTFTDFGQNIATPAVNQAVTVSVNADDPNGVDNVKLWWREDGGDWSSSPMVANVLGTYEAQIPGHAAGTIVQFYAEATDSLGVAATFPAAGPESRALLQVADGKGPLAPIDTIRVIIMREDQERLYERTNRMSNWQTPITLVHNRTVYHDVTTRQVGSRWIRPNSGYKIRFNPDQAFYGVHDTIRLDMNGMAEIVMKQMVNRAGGLKTSYYDDIAFLAIPFHQVQTTRDDQPHHSHEILLNLARLEGTFLDEQFENGSSGTKWELDDVVYPSSPNDEGLKRETVVIETADIGINGDITYVQGNDPEFYRAHILIKNQRVDDRFDVIKKFSQAIHTRGDALFDAANEVMDVDLWMRHYANQAYLGNWDTYGFRRPKNLRFYQRPEDGKIIPFFWDCDLCNFTERLFNTSEPTSRLDEIRAFPHNLRLFWGHLLDYTNRSFNAEYVGRWANHYGELASSNTFGGDETFESITESTRRRTETVIETLNETIPPVDFAITTADGASFESQATIEGTGWVNVRKIRLADSGIELDAFWPTTTNWQVDVPLTPGSNVVSLEAVDFEGNVIASGTINVTNSTQNPAIDSIRISEVHYNPGAATDAEIAAGFGNDDFEFIELVNTSDAEVSLDGVQLNRVTVEGIEQGVEFDFGVTSIGPGERLVVVEDTVAFHTRYGEITNVAGQWSGSLSNDSETITLSVDGSIIQQFTYDDQWYPSTDGGGTSLVIVDANGELDLWNQKSGWSHSGINGGSPGAGLGRPGDVNGDGVFDSSDLIAVLQAGEFEDNIDGNSTFMEGDWNGDGDFTTRDLVVAFMIGQYVNDAPIAAAKPIRRMAIGSLDRTEESIARENLVEPRFVKSQVKRHVPRALESQHVDSAFAEVGLFAQSHDQDDADDTII